MMGVNTRLATQLDALEAMNRRKVMGIAAPTIYHLQMCWVPCWMGCGRYNFAATIDLSLPPAIASADRVLDVADGLLAGRTPGWRRSRSEHGNWCAHAHLIANSGTRPGNCRTARRRRRSLTFKNMQGVAQLLIDMRFGHSNVGARIQSTRATDGHR
jgi:hypothetical protein